VFRRYCCCRLRAADDSAPPPRSRPAAAPSQPPCVSNPRHVFVTAVGFFTDTAAAATASMSADEDTPAVPASAAHEHQAQSRKGGIGRGLAWSNEELTALVVQLRCRRRPGGRVRADSGEVRGENSGCFCAESARGLLYEERHTMCSRQPPLARATSYVVPEEEQGSDKHVYKAKRQEEVGRRDEVDRRPD
jgi:hypothetical protein